MAISLNREGNPDGTIDLSVNIATTMFYNEYWEKAIKELGIKIFRENGKFSKNELSGVISELEILKQWTISNLEGIEREYMEERIVNLIEVIPEMFNQEDIILYIY